MTTLEIQRILALGSMSQVEAQKLRGRMQLAESQIFGRTGKRCIACLTDFACRRRSRITPRDALFLKLFVSLLKSDEPRGISLQHDASVVMVTNACYERDSRDLICGLGGVLVDNANGLKFHASFLNRNATCWESYRKCRSFSRQRRCVRCWLLPFGKISFPNQCAFFT